jgi:hypothetical protein
MDVLHLVHIDQVVQRAGAAARGRHRALVQCSDAVARVPPARHIVNPALVDAQDLQDELALGGQQRDAPLAQREVLLERQH